MTLLLGGWCGRPAPELNAAQRGEFRLLCLVEPGRVAFVRGGLRWMRSLRFGTHLLSVYALEFISFLRQ